MMTSAASSPLNLDPFSSNRWTRPALSPPVPSATLKPPVTAGVETRERWLALPDTAKGGMMQRVEDKGATQERVYEGPSVTSWLSPPSTFPSPSPIPQRNSTVSLVLPSPPPSSTFNPLQHSLSLSSPPPPPQATPVKKRNGISPPLISCRKSSWSTVAPSRPSVRTPQHLSVRPPPLGEPRRESGDGALLFQPFYDEQHKTELFALRTYVLPARTAALVDTRDDEERMELDLPIVQERPTPKTGFGAGQPVEVVDPFEASISRTEAETEVYAKREQGKCEGLAAGAERPDVGKDGEDDGSLTLHFSRSRGVFLPSGEIPSIPSLQRTTKRARSSIEDTTAPSPSISGAADLVSIRFEPGQWVRCYTARGREVFPGNAADRNTWLRAQLLNPLRPRRGSAVGGCLCAFVFAKIDVRSRIAGYLQDYRTDSAEGGGGTVGTRMAWKRPTVCRQHLAKCSLVPDDDPLKQLCRLLIEFEKKMSAKAPKPKAADDSPEADDSS